jgi:hypothetical protein
MKVQNSKLWVLNNIYNIKKVQYEKVIIFLKSGKASKK